MPTCLEPTDRRCHPIRLIDVPEPVRLKGARDAIRQAADLEEAVRILTIATNPPPELIAWVAA